MCLTQGNEVCDFVADTSITSGRNTFINTGEESTDLETIPRIMLIQLGFKAAPQ